MEEKIISNLNERRNKLLKDVEIIDKILETGDLSIVESQYWDDLVENFDNPQNIDESLEEGLTPEEINFLNNM